MCGRCGDSAAPRAAFAEAFAERGEEKRFSVGVLPAGEPRGGGGEHDGSLQGPSGMKTSAPSAGLRCALRAGCERRGAAQLHSGHRASPAARSSVLLWALCPQRHNRWRLFPALGAVCPWRHNRWDLLPMKCAPVVALPECGPPWQWGWPVLFGAMGVRSPPHHSSLCAWSRVLSCGTPSCCRAGDWKPLIAPCQTDFSINEFACTLLLLPVRGGKGPYFKWEKS